jgi:hypothetical protein
MKKIKDFFEDLRYLPRRIIWSIKLIFNMRFVLFRGYTEPEYLYILMVEYLKQIKKELIQYGYFDRNIDDISKAIKLCKRISQSYEEHYEYDDIAERSFRDIIVDEKVNRLDLIYSLADKIRDDDHNKLNEILKKESATWWI